MSYKSFKQILSEQSLRSSIQSIKLLNLLFHENYYTKVYDKIKLMFPIENDNDIISIIKCIEVVENNIKESFNSSNDYALTILNKVFSSNNDKIEMIKFLQDNMKTKITDLTIEDLYQKFHSRFGKI